MAQHTTMRRLSAAGGAAIPVVAVMLVIGTAVPATAAATRAPALPGSPTGAVVPASVPAVEPTTPTKNAPVSTTTRTLELGSASEPAAGVSVAKTQPAGVPLAPAVPGKAAARTQISGVLRAAATGTTFSAVGVTWQRDPSLGRVSVAVRTRATEIAPWSGWTAAGVGENDARQLATGAAPAGVRDGADLLWTGVSRAVEVVVTGVSGRQPVDVEVSLIDPGTAATDAAAGPVTAPPAALPGRPDEGTLGVPSALVPSAPSAIATVVPAPVAPGPVAYGKGVVSIYGRAAWGANPAYLKWAPAYAPGVTAVTLHHTATSNNYLPGDVPAIIRSIYYYMAVTENYGDIGYNALVDKFGRVWEGRTGGMDTAVVGGHAGGFNTGTSGIAMIGDNTKVAVSTATREAVARYTAFKLGTSGVAPNSTPWITGGPSTKYKTQVTMKVHALYPHLDTSATSCPGSFGLAILGWVRTRATALIAGYKIVRTSTPAPVVPPVVGSPTTVSTVPANTSPVAVPATGLSLYGAGFGHGHGLSQWGARGAAAQGLTSSQIVNFYYPGAALTAGGNPTIRVRLTAIDAGHFSFYPAAGATTVTGLVATAGNGTKVVLPARARYHVALSGSSYVIQEPVTATTWRTVKTLPAPVTFTGLPVVTLQLSKPKGDCKGGARISFAGSVQAVIYGGQARYVAKMPMDTYLRGVVASEMPAGWAATALQAQSIAARTYATAQFAPSVYYDIVDTQGDQCWDGVASENPATSAAIAATAGKILTTGGQAILAQFSSDSGGWTSYGGKPYLPVKSDQYSLTSGSPYVNWTAVLSPAALAAGDGAGGLTAVKTMQVTKRSTGGGRWGGRAETLVLTGVNAAGKAMTATVTGGDFRSRLGLRSTYFGFAK